jgi:hypothetical protein
MHAVPFAAPHAARGLRGCVGAQCAVKTSLPCGTMASPDTPTLPDALSSRLSPPAAAASGAGAAASAVSIVMLEMLDFNEQHPIKLECVRLLNCAWPARDPTHSGPTRILYIRCVVAACTGDSRPWVLNDPPKKEHERINLADTMRKHCKRHHPLHAQPAAPPPQALPPPGPGTAAGGGAAASAASMPSGAASMTAAAAPLSAAAAGATAGASSSSWQQPTFAPMPMLVRPALVAAEAAANAPLTIPIAAHHIVEGRVLRPYVLQHPNHAAAAAAAAAAPPPWFRAQRQQLTMSPAASSPTRRLARPGSGEMAPNVHDRDLPSPSPTLRSFDGVWNGQADQSESMVDLLDHQAALSTPVVSVHTPLTPLPPFTPHEVGPLGPLTPLPLLGD